MKERIAILGLLLLFQNNIFIFNFSIVIFNFTLIQSELVPALNQQDWLLKVSRVYVSRVLGFKSASQRGVVFNGRVLGPFRDDEIFDEDDFLLLERSKIQFTLLNIFKKIND